MPTQSTTYNSRVTDEALEKRFRDTFRSQGGAELVDDLYAQGVIVPVVDFTAAATGQQLQENLQTAWDFSTGKNQVTTSNVTLISNAGFWQVDLTAHIFSNNSTIRNWLVEIYDGSTAKVVWAVSSTSDSTVGGRQAVVESKFVVFLRSGDILRATSPVVNYPIDIWYRQIATVNGDLVNPTGFTSS